MWETGDILKVSKLSTENHLHLHDYVNAFDVWVPQKLSGVGGIPFDHISTSGFPLKPKETILLPRQILRGMNG